MKLRDANRDTLLGLNWIAHVVVNTHNREILNLSANH